MTTFFRLAALAVAFAATASHAGTINGLFNTGVDSTGAAIGDGATDTHYQILTRGQAIAVNDGGSPFPAWVANNSGSRWVGIQADGRGPNSTNTNFTYRTTFSIPANADLSTVSISGLWGTDNQGLDILVNGNSTGLTNPTQFVSLTPFTIPNTGQYVHGLNTLDFSLRNISGFTGLRVDRLSGTFAVPEPGSVTALLLGLASFAGLGRRFPRV